MTLYSFLYTFKSVYSFYFYNVKYFEKSLISRGFKMKDLIKELKEICSPGLIAVALIEAGIDVGEVVKETINVVKDGQIKSPIYHGVDYVVSEDYPDSDYHNPESWGY